GFGKVVFLRNRLQQRVGQPILQRHDGGRVSLKIFGRKGIHLKKRKLHTGIMRDARLFAPMTAAPMIYSMIRSELMFLRAIIPFLMVAAAFGQQSLSLDGAVQRALENHPELAAAANRVEAQQGLRLQAGKTYNPTFNFQWENLRTWQQP